MKMCIAVNKLKKLKSNVNVFTNYTSYHVQRNTTKVLQTTIQDLEGDTTRAVDDILEHL